jgi:hypothetical protein
MGYEASLGLCRDLATCIKCKHYWQDMKACSVEPLTFIGPEADKVGRFCGRFEIRIAPIDYELFEGN